MSPRRRRPVQWRPRPLPIAAAGTAAFVGLTGFLGVRVAMGNDPALGGGTKTTTTKIATPADTTSAYDDSAVTQDPYTDDSGSYDDGSTYSDDGSSSSDDGSSYSDDGSAYSDGSTSSDPGSTSTDSGSSSSSSSSSATPNPSTGTSGG